MIQSLMRLAVLPLAAVLFAGAPLAAQRFPAEPGDGVADLAGVLSPADAAGIRGIISRMRATPGVEVAVLTVRSVDEYGARTQEEFATGVYNAWRLGAGQRQDGVLVLLSLDDRFTRIELGDGVPADQDARMRAIVDQVMVPRFRGGDMGGGLHDGVLAVAEAFGTQAPAASGESGTAAQTAPQPAVPAEPQPWTAVPATGPATLQKPADEPVARPANGLYDIPLSRAMMPLVTVLVAITGVFAVALLVRMRRPKCAPCGLEMLRLDEAADDVYLDSGRRLEEVLGSVDYAVWKCPGCSGHEIKRSSRWFSGKETCPQCGYKTVNVERNTLQHPTYDHGGTQHVAKDCAHCHWHDEDTVHLPQLERPASSSSRSSFSSSGGSSSSGGGSESSSGSSGGSSSGRGSSGHW